MVLEKKDFIEIEFTGKTLNDGKVFDSNIKENLEKLHTGHNHSIEAKPFIFALGQGMFLKGIDDFLIGKSFARNTYKILLSPENAFGNRDARLVQKIPIRVFKEQKMNPFPGAVFNFDGRIGKVLAVSGGRILTDFNNPLAGKEVVYEIKILRKIDNINEKIKAFNEFLFKRDLEFEIHDKKLVLKIEKSLINFAEMFKEKYKELFGLELRIEGIEEKSKKLQ